MIKHTPGPWTVSSDSWVSNHVDIDAPTHGALAVVVWRMEEDDRSPECEANARLIAAAPDLLEACEALTSIQYIEQAAAGPLKEALLKAIAALSKARGDK